MRLEAVVDEAFRDPALSQTLAVLVRQHDRLVAERYGGFLERFDGPPVPVTAASTLTSWSMAKSMLHAVVGMLVAEARLDPDAPAPVPRWAGDERSQITLRHLLQMRDGLAFVEDYVDGGSDVIEMLWGRGAADVAAFAEDRPLAARPGERFNYSSGTSNVISGIVARTLGPGDPYRAFLRDRLFGPLGMTTAKADFDEAGTWIASSTVWATASDFARFGSLYLHGGVCDSTRLLPESWVHEAGQPVSVDEEGLRYSSHWWVIDDGRGTFSANGYEGQRITVCPAAGAVIVRLGKTPAERYPELRAWMGRMINALDP